MNDWLRLPPAELVLLCCFGAIALVVALYYEEMRGAARSFINWWLGNE